MEKQRYTPEEAMIEADLLKEKIDSGETDNYQEAEDIVEAEKYEELERTAKYGLQESLDKVNIFIQRAKISGETLENHSYILTIKEYLENKIQDPELDERSRSEHDIWSIEYMANLSVMPSREKFKLTPSRDRVLKDQRANNELRSQFTSYSTVEVLEALSEAASGQGRGGRGNERIRFERALGGDVGKDPLLENLESSQKEIIKLHLKRLGGYEDGSFERNDFSDLAYVAKLFHLDGLYKSQ